MKKLSSGSTKQNYDSSFVQDLIRCNVLLKEQSNKLADEKRQLRKKYFSIEKQLNVKEKNLLDQEAELEKLREEIKSLEKQQPKASPFSSDSPFLIRKGGEKSIIDDSLILNSPLDKNILDRYKVHETTAMLLKSEDKNEKKRKNPFLKHDLNINDDDSDCELLDNKQIKLSDLSKICFNKKTESSATDVHVVKPIEHKSVSLLKTKSSSSLVSNVNNLNSVYKYVYDGFGGHKKLFNSLTNNVGTTISNNNVLLRKNLTNIKVSKR